MAGESSLVRLNGFYPPQSEDAVTQLIRGARILEIAGISHNQIDYERSELGRFVIHPVYPGLQSLDTYLQQRRNGQVDQAKEVSLLDFVISTHPFQFIGDFGVDQVAYDGKEWRLIDWSNEHYLIADSAQSHTWSAFDFVGNEDLFVKISEAISITRSKYIWPLPCLQPAVRLGIASISYL